MIRILIVDDQNTIQELLKNYFEPEPDLEVVGVAANGQVAIEKVEELKPDIVLMDLEMPGGIDGFFATRIICERFVETKVLILSIHDRKKYLNTALEVGAKGYMLKTTPASELVNSIRSAHKGYFQLGPGLLEKYLSEIVTSTSNADELKEFNQVIENEINQLGKTLGKLDVKQREMGKIFDDKASFLFQHTNFIKNEVDRVHRGIKRLKQSMSILAYSSVGLFFILLGIIVFSRS